VARGATVDEFSLVKSMLSILFAMFTLGYLLNLNLKSCFNY